MSTKAIDNVFNITWIPAGQSYQGLINSGTNDIIWIKEKNNLLKTEVEHSTFRERSLRIMITTNNTSSNVIAQGIKRTLAHGGRSLKYPELQSIIDWIKNNRSTA